MVLILIVSNFKVSTREIRQMLSWEPCVHILTHSERCEGQSTLSDLVELQGSFKKCCVPLTHSNITSHPKHIVLTYFIIAHGLVGWEFGSVWLGDAFVSHSQLASLGNIQLVAGLEGPRQLNSCVWHLGMDIWAAGHSWALSLYSWGI